MQEINYIIEIKNISIWINKVLKKSNKKSLVIGLSGGVDSATSASLVVNSIGSKNLFVVLMPYGEMNSRSLKDAKMITEFLKIPSGNIINYNIQESVTSVVSSLPDISDIRKGNIMARMRMIYLFDFAKKQNALVCGTENKSEHYLGYYTRFGDESSDLEPIRYLYKTQVWEMAKRLRLPQQIINKAPTAGLWENQTDESEFGFSYREADQILYYYFDKHLSKEEIIAQGIQKKIIEKVLKRVSQNDFKHHLPYVFFP